jgi:16S rRNA (cytosine967-C5)-methyltransferase
MIKTQGLAAAAAAKVLAGSSLTAVLQGVWHSHTDLSAQQRGAIQDLSYGVLRFYGQLDVLLGLLLKKPLKDQNLRCLLLVALYQLEYSKTASHAVVDNAVSVSRTFGRGKSARGVQGLVNAVLRNFIRNRSTLLARVAECEVGQYSHPQWWIDKLRAQYPQDYKTVLDNSNKRPPMTLRVNRRKAMITEYQNLLTQSGMDARPSGNNALELSQPVAVVRLPGFAEGLVSVQDAGAQMAARLLDVRDHMRVLDACAAPGGKSAHLLELADIELTAVDNDIARVARITQNFTRLGLKASHIIHGNASQPAEWWDGKLFDRILADVPCSASGVTRRHPDIKWLRRESDLFQFVAKQREILDALWQILASDGKLLYATCSVFTEENELQVKNFLRYHSDARLVPISGIEATDGQILPNSHHDGFFYALLHKA